VFASAGLHTGHIGFAERFDAGPAARAPSGSSNSAVTRRARRALPIELGMDRYNHRNATKNERSMGSYGNGTVSSAMAPSEGPVYDAHQSKIFESGISMMSSGPEYLDA
jgi:hypothetical protein